MRKSSLRCAKIMLLGLSLLLSYSNGFSKVADQPEKVIPAKKQPIQISSDTADYEHVSGISHFKGHVHVQMDQDELWCDILTVWTDQQQQIKHADAHGQLALFRLKGADGQLVNGQALLIRFFPAQKQWHLIGKAQLRQNQNTFSSPKIDYDQTKQSLAAQTIAGHRPQMIFYPEAKP